MSRYYRSLIEGVLPSNPLWNNLLAYYTADNTPNDALGTYNGTLTNGATYGTGIINQGFSLDGVDDFFQLGNVLDFNGDTPFSFSLWVNTSQANTQIFNKVINSNSSRGYRLFIDVNKVNFIIQASSTNRLHLKTVDDFSSNWNLINVTYDGLRVPSSIKIYLNGVNQSLTTVANTFTVSSANSNNLTFGVAVGAIPYLNGALDEIGCWGRVITSTEVTELYNSGAGKQYPN